LRGEWMYEIRGMAVPETAVADDLVDNGAIRLFIQSARRVDNQFVLAPEDPGHILHICHLVDGMPLGIELAASWVRLLSCKEIAEEMAHSMDFLRSELRNVPERHRSVRASFDLSWGLLSHAEKLVLARLSVYSGVFGRDAAELEAGATLEILAGLVNKSLLTRVGTGQFKLHNLVRQYAALHLEELNSSLPTAQRAYMPERAPRVVMAGRNAWQS
jgi:predicted ATPase